MKDYTELSKAFQAFKDRCHEIATFMSWPDERVGMNNETSAYVGGTVYGSWGSSDDEWYDFPVAWMNLPDEEFKTKWYALDKKNQEKKRIAIEKAELEVKQKNAEIREKNDLAAYERLKAKYETKSE